MVNCSSASSTITRPYVLVSDIFTLVKTWDLAVDNSLWGRAMFPPAVWTDVVVVVTVVVVVAVAVVVVLGSLFAAVHRTP